MNEMRQERLQSNVVTYNSVIAALAFKNVGVAWRGVLVEGDEAK